MPATISWVQTAKLKLASKKLDYEEYKLIRYEFIKLNEGCRQFSYSDSKGHITVGIGFNMDAAGARDQWNKAFYIAGTTISFDEVYKGQRKMNDDEIKILFDHSIETRRSELKAIYRLYWDKLKPHEQLAIEDMYYNNPKLVNSKTNFFKHICKYIDTGNQGHLNEAIYEVQSRSNPEINPVIKNGIQARRNVEAELLKPTNIENMDDDDITLTFNDDYIIPIAGIDDDQNNNAGDWL